MSWQLLSPLTQAAVRQEESKRIGEQQPRADYCAWERQHCLCCRAALFSLHYPLREAVFHPILVFFPPPSSWERHVLLRPASPPCEQPRGGTAPLVLREAAPGRQSCGSSLPSPCQHRESLCLLAARARELLHVLERCRGGCAAGTALPTTSMQGSKLAPGPGASGSDFCSENGDTEPYHWTPGCASSCTRAERQGVHSRHGAQLAPLPRGQQPGEPGNNAAGTSFRKGKQFLPRLSVLSQPIIYGSDAAGAWPGHTGHQQR